MAVCLSAFLLVEPDSRAQELSGPITLAATASLELREADAFVDRMNRAGDLKLIRVQADPLLPGRTHERLAQYHQGVPIDQADITRQLDGGLTRSVFGSIHGGIDLDSTPTLSADEARTSIERLAGASMNPGVQPELAVLPLDAGGYALIYHGRVFTGTDLRKYYVDAHTGTLVLEHSDLLTQGTVGTGQGVLGDTKKISVTPMGGGFVAQDGLRPIDVLTYDMRGDVELVRRVLNGSHLLADSELATSTDNRWSDPVEVDGHVYSGWTYDYYFRSFGGASGAGLVADIAGLKLITLVHPVNRDNVGSAPPTDIDLFYLNAFYCHGCAADGNGVLVYGEGLPPGFRAAGSVFNFWVGALDIVAHEMTHFLTANTSRLSTRDTPGALNEAFSDIMGTAVEFFFQAPGDGLQQADYLVGEDIIDPLLAGFNRSLADPQRFGDPDHVSKLFTGTTDNGGVHTNSLIASHAFYLAVEGGTNRTSGVSVQGVGQDQLHRIVEVFVRAFAFLLPSNATFQLARNATIQSARDLDPGGALEAAVTQAWNAVGVN